MEICSSRTRKKQIPPPRNKIHLLSLKRKRGSWKPSSNPPSLSSRGAETRQLETRLGSNRERGQESAEIISVTIHPSLRTACVRRDSFITFLHFICLISLSVVTRRRPEETKCGDHTNEYVKSLRMVSIARIVTIVRYKLGARRE